MRPVKRTTLALIAIAGTALLATGCGKAGSSGTPAPASAAAAGGCAPVAGGQLVALTDDKKLQTVDNIIPAVNAKAAKPGLLDALNKVSAALDTTKLIALNKATDVDHQTPPAAAAAFAASSNLTAGIAKGAGGPVTIGAANFSENQTLAELYRIALKAAGFDAKVQTVGNRELYEPALEKGQLQLVPEYAGTLTEFLNSKVNGANPSPMASSDLSATVTALKNLGGKAGLVFGEPSMAADQNSFAVTTAFAGKYGVSTLSQFASKCSGKDTVLGGPPECPQRPFCEVGLQKTYGITFGSFKSLDAGGSQTKNALTTGTISLGLVFSSDAALAPQAGPSAASS